MLKRKLVRRALSRLISGLFAVQLIAAGFCLMMPQAHAMSVAQASHSMADSMISAEHCSQAMETQMGHGMEHSACSHCDQPDSLLQNVSTLIQLDLDMQADLLPVPKASDWVSQSIAFFSRTPTGPPCTSSLLYQTTQRILI